ncbi:ABC transporter substrate-binding protein [Dolichospermum compactum]|uniref:Extracellular ligand-binding receptor n=1 Tax=Dolichospermum compactum NIES-806 TaxID=1973481 RepID=A0A1Z4V384_9CYAN|nr:ABC transporter substrate-binding protein [Dolichospermum compactum]BAZ85894.1 extracellular ligand-binding receptor [Dolichospermum compactum NIES-806]
MQNPYVVGIPIRDPENLFGRKDIFSLIDDSLQHNVQLILFYGQRRVGKTSILKFIPQNIAAAIEDEFIFISFDFQAQESSPLENILHGMAKKILGDLSIDEEFLDSLADDIKSDTNVFSSQFLPTIYDRLGSKKLVFLCDEFDVLSEPNARHIIQLRELLRELHERLFIIAVVGRHISRLPKLISLLHEAPYHRIGFLDRENTKKIITQSDTVALTYQPEAIEAIFNLSAGHPYFIQVICFALYGTARNDYTRDPRPEFLRITDTDVESIIDQAIVLAQGALDFWFGLTPEQQIILSAVAESQKIAITENQSIPEQPLTLLEKYGIVSTGYLIKAHEQLVEYEFLDDTKCKVKMELVRRLLCKEHPLEQEIKNVESTNQIDVNNLNSVAQSHPDRALHLYEQALHLNPNNFETVKSLAAEYLKIQDLSIQSLDKACELYNRAYLFYSINHQQDIVLDPLLTVAEQYSKNDNFEQAIEIYTRAYNIDKERSKNGLLQTRGNYIHKLIVNKKRTEAIQQCELILEIDPNNNIAQQELEKINAFMTNTNPLPQEEDTTPKKKTPIANINWLKWGVTGIAIAVVSLGIYPGFRTCPAGEKKEFGVFCVADNSRISRGERTLFSTTPNRFRDQGIRAFQKGDYQQAANLFKQAIQANRNDPEVVIYYNNALAREAGSPITLAVVVPTDTKTVNAQEILRGVAQAQDQFTKNKGLNGRLLEIVIANDSNNDQAEQVAQELVKDTSILGVIGHNSSDATQTALPEYEKAGLAVISPTSTSILLNNPVFFRAVYSDQNGGRKLAEYAYKNLQLKKAVIFANPNSDYSNSIREIFTNQFEKLGGEVVRKPMIDLTATTFDAEKEVAKSVYGEKKAEAAFLFPDTQSTGIAIKIAKEITSRNERLRNSPPIRQLKMLSGDTLYNNETLVRRGKDTEGLIIVIPWFRETLQAKPFAQKLDQIWGGGISWRTATSYDATQAFIKVLSNNLSRTTVLEGLEKVKLDSRETSGYPLEFTKERERQGESILVQIKDGKFVEIK